MTNQEKWAVFLDEEMGRLLPETVRRRIEINAIIAELESLREWCDGIRETAELCGDRMNAIAFETVVREITRRIAELRAGGAK